ncbi:hypothetical protein PF010_g8342 [Phytophthora fragariae]|nr:hypothetical protein PF011_g7995 [Phytophthora fragariae]KAE9118086.1 hypothetical protein PF010_g8342 [Phytophthora fragariae]
MLALLVAVLLDRYHLFLSCCSASSSATAPMASIATVSCYSATGSSSATAPICPDYQVARMLMKVA